MACERNRVTVNELLHLLTEEQESDWVKICYLWLADFESNSSKVLGCYYPGQNGFLFFTTIDKLSNTIWLKASLNFRVWKKDSAVGSAFSPIPNVCGCDASRVPSQLNTTLTRSVLKFWIIGSSPHQPTLDCPSCRTLHNSLLCSISGKARDQMFQKVWSQGSSSMMYKIRVGIQFRATSYTGFWVS